MNGNRPDTKLLLRMERDWDERARQQPEFYIASAREQWTPDDFFRSGEINVENQIIADRDLICRNRGLREMQVLELGCGAGRMTRALAQNVKCVHAVDISAEMITLAKQNLADVNNVVLYKNSGADLSGLPDGQCDFAFSFIVFQHIPAREVILNYFHEVYRCLKPDAVFKLQVQGDTGAKSGNHDTWVGLPITPLDAKALAHECGFDIVQTRGEGTQYFWLWLLKPRCPWIPRILRRTVADGVARGLWLLRPRIKMLFSSSAVAAGGRYVVCVRKFAGQTIDIAYELVKAGERTVTSGVVSKWCELDSNGQANISVPIDHPAGVVTITRVRSQTCCHWVKAGGAITVRRDDAAESA